MADPVVTCRICAFWASGPGESGHCKHGAPRPTERADDIAYWPETFTTDMCGQGVVAAGPSPVGSCAQCAFWRRSIHNDGLYPVDRLGARGAWWREAGHCMRFAPGASSVSGQRGFWRVTHRTDGCAEAQLSAME